MAETVTHPQLTLMAVHAHPDDESSSTGGVLAKYADAGVRTVVVTCTNGEFGDTLDVLFGNAHYFYADLEKSTAQELARLETQQ